MKKIKKKHPGPRGGVFLKNIHLRIETKNMKKEIYFLGTIIYVPVTSTIYIPITSTIYVPVTSNLHTSVLNNGSMVSPRGFRQINCLVPWEPFRQERSAYT